MKKFIVILSLILIIAGSIVAGTLANYTTTIDKVASGSVIGKDFIFTEDGSDTFEHGIKIAPGETVSWEFAVKNYQDTKITETDLYYKLTFDVHATTDKSVIDPLVITLKDENGDVIDAITGTGTIQVTGSFPLSTTGQSDAFTVEIYWPESNETDINYAGGNYGTTIGVAAIASQIAFEEEPEEPEEASYSVAYAAQTAWTEGAYWDWRTQSLVGGTQKHNFSVTITNNSAETVSGWTISFTLAETITYNWSSVMKEKDTSTGRYSFSSPAYYNNVIEPGGSVTFTGQAIGNGLNPITNVSVNGEAVTDVECTYNVGS